MTKYFFIHGFMCASILYVCVPVCNVKLILNNPEKNVILQRSQGNNSKTWIKSIDINLLTGVANVESISNLENR